MAQTFSVLSSICGTVVIEIRAAGVTSLLTVRFLVKIPGNLGMLLKNRVNQLLGNLVIFKNLSSFWKLMVWIRKILSAKAASKWVSFCLKYLVKFY
jgi:hypothetical protein